MPAPAPISTQHVAAAMLTDKMTPEYVQELESQVTALRYANQSYATSATWSTAQQNMIRRDEREDERREPDSRMAENVLAATSRQRSPPPPYREREQTPHPIITRGVTRICAGAPQLTLATGRAQFVRLDGTAFDVGAASRSRESQRSYLPPISNVLRQNIPVPPSETPRSTDLFAPPRTIHAQAAMESVVAAVTRIPNRSSFVNL